MVSTGGAVSPTSSASDRELRIHLLGGFRAAVGDRSVDEDSWRLRKAKGVLKLLALAPGHRLHREQLMDTLWPDLEPRAAANQLRKALHEARRGLHPDPEVASRLVGSRDGMVLLAPGTSVDVERFRAAVARARRTGVVDAYAEALRLYGGDLLPEDPYEDWAVLLRDELRAEFVAVAVDHAGLLEARAELEAAMDTLRRALEAEPTHEEAHRALMRVYALAGRRHDALRQYEQLRAVLRRDLDAEPDVPTVELFEEIRSGRLPEAEVRAGLWERVGDLRSLSGDALGAAGAYRSALEGTAEGDAPAAARMHRKAASALLKDHHASEAEEHLDAAEKLLVHLEEEAELGRLLGARANWLWEMGRFEEAQSAAEKSRAIAEREGDPEDVAAAYEALAIVYHFRGEWREGLHVELERLGASADEAPELSRIFDIHHCIGEYHLYGDALFGGVEEYARETLERATRSGARRAQAFAWCLLGESLLLQGRWDESAGCLQRAGEIHAELGTRSGALPWQRLGELAAYRGDLEEAEGHVRRGMTIATVSPMAPHMWGRLYATVALAALEAGDPEAAVRAVRAAAGAASRHGDCPTCSALVHPLAAEAHASLGEAEEAALHAEAAERTAGFWESSAWKAMGVTARAFHRSATADPAGAAEGLMEAAELYERGGQPFWAARSRMLAALVHGDADPESRRRLLEEAAGTFRRLGARLAERRAAGLGAP